MEFTYFKDPKKYAAMTASEVACDLCGAIQTCFDAEGFFGEEEIAAICPDCLQTGRLQGRSIFTNQGDLEELEHQLMMLHPQLDPQALTEMIPSKRFELEQATPQLVTWQDWEWPCADGDFCEFLQYGSRSDFNRLAADGNGKHLFATTLYEDLKDITDIDETWQSLPDKPIKSIEDSDYETVSYIFKSRISNKIVTVWDCS